MIVPREGPPTTVRFTFREKQSPLLLDVSSLLYDVELLHDLTVLVSFEAYSRFTFSRYFWYRTGRSILPEDRLRVRSLKLQSPLAAELIFGSAAAVWAVLQVIDKIANWRLNRQKLRLEVQKLEHETATRGHEEQTARARLEAAIQQREAGVLLGQIVRRLESNPIVLVDVDVTEPDPMLPSPPRRRGAAQRWSGPAGIHPATCERLYSRAVSSPSCWARSHSEGGRAR